MLTKKAEQFEEAKRATGLSEEAANEYCELLTRILHAPNLEADARPKYVESLALAQMDMLIQDAPQDRDAFTPEKHDYARLFFEARIDGNSDKIAELRRKMEERGNKLDRYIVARLAYDDAKKNVARCVKELQKAAESDVKWAQKILKAGLVAELDTGKKLTVKDPLGKEPAGIVIPRSEWVKGALYESRPPQPRRWFTLPADLPESPAPRVSFGSVVEAEGLASIDPVVGGLAFFHRGKSYPLRKDKGGQFSIAAPEGTEADSTIKGELRLPGWASKTVVASVAADGDFVVGEKIKLLRQVANLPVSLGSSGTCDYDVIEAQWVGPLDGEKSAPSPTKPVPIPITKDGLQTEVPTGVYALTLTSPASSNIIPFLWKKEIKVAAGDAAVDVADLPASLQGKYFCMPMTIKDSEGIFASLSISTKIQSTTFIGIQKLINSTLGYDDVSSSRFSLENRFGPVERPVLIDPWTLEFECLAPVNSYYHKWRLKAESDGTMWMTVLLMAGTEGDAYVASVRRAISSLEALKNSRTEIQEGLLQGFKQAIGTDTKPSDPPSEALSALNAYNSRSIEEARRNGDGLKQQFPAIRESTEPIVYYFQVFPRGAKYKPVKDKDTGNWDLTAINR